MSLPTTSMLSSQVNQMSVFWKQRDNLFFPVSCYVLPITILRLPYSLVNTLVWSMIVYWATGLTYSAGRCLRPHHHHHHAVATCT